MKRPFIALLLCCICALAVQGGINNTLRAAQEMYAKAKTIADYENARRKFRSAEADVGYVAAEHAKAISEGVRKCDRRIGELTPRLSVNGSSTGIDISFGAAGGTRTLSISTNQGTPYTALLPSWIGVTSISATSVVINCHENKSTSGRSDWFNVCAGGKTVRVNVSQSGASAPRTPAPAAAPQASSDTYLKVDGKTAVSTSFAGTGGTETFYISTDADSWRTWGVPPFCEVTSRSATSFTIRCKPNTESSARTDYMKVKTDNHEVRIDIRQAAGSAGKINRIWVDHNHFQGMQKGMLIHIDFEVDGLRGHTINPVAYFEFSDGSALKDFDGSYRTTDGHVGVGHKSTADYEGTRWKDFKLFMPYNQLHMSRGSFSLQFKVYIYDSTTDKTLVQSDAYGFTFSQ
ncbi:MAG: hypothetical protein NC406_02175 [Bacteroides sp.]|nr:hypothetical protein [Bacteroides sp.]MCM1094844.1 hypothetical protein [Terasakiella sp.]